MDVFCFKIIVNSLECENRRIFGEISFKWLHIISAHADFLKM